MLLPLRLNLEPPNTAEDATPGVTWTPLLRLYK